MAETAFLKRKYYYWRKKSYFTQLCEGKKQKNIRFIENKKFNIFKTKFMNQKSRKLKNCAKISEQNQSEDFILCGKLWKFDAYQQKIFLK